MKPTSLFLMAAVAAAPLSAAELTGKVTVKGTPPPPKEIATVANDPTCGKLRTTPLVVRTWVVGADSGLGNVVVYIKAGLEGKTFTPPTEPAVVDQTGCAYEPYVTAVMASQTISIKNSDPVLHNVNAQPKVNTGFNFAQATQGQKNDKSFPKPEMGIKFACNVHPWMLSYVSVLENPFFAVSDKDGNFKISGDLPDGKYTLAAFHQKGGEVTKEIEVKGGKATQSFEIEFK
jgi:plastocyanin